MYLSKVTGLVIAILVAGVLIVPASAQLFPGGYSYGPYTRTYSYGSPYGSSFGNPYGLMSQIGSAFGGSPLGTGSYYGSPYGTSYGSNPYDYSNPYGSYYGYGSPTLTQSTPSSGSSIFGNSPTTDLFSSFGSGSPFASLFGGTAKKVYGPPPTDAITNTLVGQQLPYNSGYMGISIPYKVEKSDIGQITGTQYRGQDAWDVAVGQNGMLWDVILDSPGTKILSERQTQG